MSRRKHDGFFKYVYTVPENARAMLNTLSRHSTEMERILNNVDLTTLEEIPERYDNVDEYGEADIAFKVATTSGVKFYFGILLEHKSEHKTNVLEQTFRYAFNVMVDKNNATFKWMPTKAIIIYNGTDNWDPLDDYRNSAHADFEGRELPFECAFIDLKQVSDALILQSDTPEAAIGLLAMKYAFDAEAFSKAVLQMEPLFRKMPNDKGTTLLQKIELYLGEYINANALEELKMAFKSLGERLGFVSAGDVRRAREKQIRKESEKRGEIRGEKRGEIIGRKAEQKKAEADKLDAARAMLAEGDSVDKICRVLKLTEEQVAKL